MARGTHDIADLPDLSWPEHYGPADGDELVAQIFERLSKLLGDIPSELILVPDPPPFVPIHLTSDRELRRLPWGAGGIAYLTERTSDFRRVTAEFLAARTTTLSVIVLNPRRLDLGGEEKRACAIDAIRFFLEKGFPPPSDVDLAGVYFDMGHLSRCQVHRLGVTSL